LVFGSWYLAKAAKPKAKPKSGCWSSVIGKVKTKTLALLWVSSEVSSNIFFKPKANSQRPKAF
jgi:hypothetical protein